MCQDKFSLKILNNLFSALPSPYNATFIPNESKTEAKITWWMTVDFIVTKYVIDLSEIYGSKTYVYIADKNSSTMFTAPLHSEFYYQYLSISLYADTLCGQSSTSLRLQKIFLYFQVI